MKKYLPYIIVLLVLVAVGVGAYFFINSRSTQAPPPTKKIVEAVNTVDVSDRPYVTLSPTVEKHPAGTEVELTVHNTTLGATEAEYELEYQAGSLLQGAFGSMDFSIDKPPVSKTLLLGTCSAGGKCDYNKDVSGGTVLLRLSGGQEKFAVKGEWTYQQMADREGKFSSRDSKFRVDVGAKGLPSATWVIVMQPIGLPEPLESEVVGGPYHISAGASAKSAEVSLRLSSDVESATLLGWTGSRWQKYDADLEDKTLTAEVNDFTTFVAVLDSGE